MRIKLPSDAPPPPPSPQQNSLHSPTDPSPEQSTKNPKKREREASTHNASTLNASTRNASTRNASTHNALTLNASTLNASTHNASTHNASSPNPPLSLPLTDPSIERQPKKKSAQTPTPTPPYTHQLTSRDLKLVPQAADGNCLFRSVSLQLYGDAELHDDVRKNCMNYIESEKPHFLPFLPSNEPFERYVRRKRRNGTHGNNTEIQAMSELYSRPVEIYTPETGGINPINIFHDHYNDDPSSNQTPPNQNPPLRLSYHDNNHYNAITSTILPTFGVGLGLPGLVPGLADVRQVDDAKTRSDLEEDRRYQEKILAISEMEAVGQEIEQAVVRESMIQGEWRGDYFGGGGGSGSNSNSNGNSNSSDSRVKNRNNNYPPTRPRSPTLQFADQFPNSVQELISNGFPSDKVLRAYDLVGDNLDELLLLLMS